MRCATCSSSFTGSANARDPFDYFPRSGERNSGRPYLEEVQIGRTPTFIVIVDDPLAYRVIVRRPNIEVRHNARINRRGVVHYGVNNQSSAVWQRDHVCKPMRLVALTHDRGVMQ